MKKEVCLVLQRVLLNLGLRAKRSLRAAALFRQNRSGVHAKWSSFSCHDDDTHPLSKATWTKSRRVSLVSLRYCCQRQGRLQDVENLLPNRLPESILQQYSMRVGSKR